MAFGLRIFMEISVFRTFLNFADIEMKLLTIINHLQIQFEFRRVFFFFL
jgi:hypothetical protein